MELVILVDEFNKEIGSMEKLNVHKVGLLHRAFSIFIVDKERKNMLLQQRAYSKYHSGGLWSNACCGHPRPLENLVDAAKRRLNEELGFETHLENLFEFKYFYKFENGLFENEYDTVLLGVYDKEIYPNINEVNSWCYKSIESIKFDLSCEFKIKYTYWFNVAFPLFYKLYFNK